MKEDLDKMLAAFSRFGSLMNRAKDADISEDDFFAMMEKIIIEKEKTLTPEFIAKRDNKKEYERLTNSIEYNKKEIEKLQTDFEAAQKRYPKYGRKKERVLEKYEDGEISDMLTFRDKIKELRQNDEYDRRLIEDYPKEMQELQAKEKEMTERLAELEKLL